LGTDSVRGEGKNVRYKISKGDEVKSKKWGKRFKKSLRILWEALKKFNGDHGFFLSAGITFNLLICLVPFILLLLSLLGTYLYSYREVLDHIRHYLHNALSSFDPKIMKNILRIIQDRKIVGVLGIGGLIWTSTWVFSSLRTSLNMVFQVDKGRGILREKGIDLLMIVLAGAFLFTSMMFTSVITIVQGYRFSPFLDMVPIIRFILKYFIPFLFTFWMCFLIYKIIPSKKIHFKTALQTAFFTSLFWEVAKQFFGWYVLHLGRFSMVYGSLSTLAIFFIWVYYSSSILILGGEVAFLLEKEKGYK
jgi:membrane protein